MTVRFHPPEDPVSFADLLVTLLARAALAQASGSRDAAASPSGEAAAEPNREEVAAP